MSLRKRISHFSDNKSLVQYIFDNLNIHLSFSKFYTRAGYLFPHPPIHVRGETVNFIATLTCDNVNKLLFF